ncbi:pseudaminic acid cytidylyltransferase [Glaciecola sp. MH2013]|nr:pseudaminic acid cytidylyltransferase [Glaciecola sp. MH2013]
MAVIPARGGSKRIIGKNTRVFAGQPLIAYSIKVAQSSGLFDDIIVTTDSDKIADLAKQFGATVPFLRPSDLSDDLTGTRPVTNHAIRWYQDNIGALDYCCCIYATAPFLQANYLKAGLDALDEDSSKAFAYSVTSFPFPIQRALFMQANYAEPAFKEDIMKRSQDLPEAYHDAGQFYWGRAEDYLSSKAIFSEHGIPIILPRHLVQDIDTEEDWLRAELMYKAYMQSSHETNSGSN